MAPLVTSLRSCGVILLMSGLLQVAAAQESLNTTSSHSQQEFVGWVDLPDMRGTFDILSNCLLTIVACTWSVLHLNLPDHEDSYLRKLQRKLKWTIVTIFFPEFILAHAASERQVAIENINDLKVKELFQSQAESEKLKDVEVTSLGHWNVETDIFWEDWVLRPGETWKVLRAIRRKTEDVEACQKGATVTMATTVGTVCGPSDKAVTWSCKTCSPFDGEMVKTWTLAHSYYANMGGIRVRTRDDGHGGPAQTYLCTAKHLAQIDFDPDYSPLRRLTIDKDEIMDKCDTDAFAKAIAVLQIAWLILNIIARGIRHLFTTQLEIVTLAYSVVAICIYMAYWNKPQNVETATTIYLDIFSRDPERDQQIRAALQPAGSTSFFGKVVWHSDLIQGKATCCRRIPNDNYNFDLLPHCLIALVLCTALFGGLHCLAWNFKFPTNVDLQMWRAACLVTTVVPVLIFASQFLVTHYKTRKHRCETVVDDLELHPVHSFMVTVGYVAYIVSRIIIMAIALASLRWMPYDVYIDTWAEYLPSVQG